MAVIVPSLNDPNWTVPEAVIFLRDLKEAMKSDVNSKTGENVFNPVVAISLMVFYVFAAQCVATFAVVRTETNTWKWPIFMIVYMTSLAYLASLLVYQFGKNFI